MISSYHISIVKDYELSPVNAVYESPSVDNADDTIL